MGTATNPDGTRIAFTDSEGGEADQPAVVLVHGITESRATWEPIIERLTPDHRVIALDLRGHGESDLAERYDLEAMASDVATVVATAGADRPHLVGHSLGGAVVSALGAAMDTTSIMNVDQSLRLGGFKESLMPAEAMLRDPDSFQAVIEGVFAEMVGTKLPAAESARITRVRNAKQEVVLGVWDLLFSMSVEEIDGVVEQALAGYAHRRTRYLSLFGIDPGDDYAPWLQRFISGAVVELWADHGHYPHLVDPDRFVDRLTSFWSAG